MTSSARLQHKQNVEPKAARPPDLRRRSLVHTGYTNKHEMPNISGTYTQAICTEEYKESES